MFLGKGVLEICSKFTGEHPCQSAISIMLLNRYTSVQTNVKSHKKIEITHLKCKNKSLLPVHANVMRQTKKKAIAYNKNQQKERGNWR